MDAADVKHHRPEKLKMLFFRACKVGDLKALSTCLRTGLISVDELDADGLRGLDHACFLGHEETAKLLVSHGASVKTVSGSGITVLHTAALGGRENLIRWLVEQGADINATNKDGLTPLHFGSDGRTAVVKTLLALGAGVDCVTNYLGYTALHKAVIGQHVDIVKYLLANCSNPNIRSKNGDTPLHLACFHGCLEIAKLLVANSASLHVVNKDGMTPRQVAQAERQLEVMTWIDSLSGNKGKGHEVVVATENFVSSLPEHLSYNEGDFIEVLSRPFEDWWMGRVGGTGRTGLFCTLMVDTRPLVLLEGKCTTEMHLKHVDASLKVNREVKGIIEEVSSELKEESVAKLLEYKTAPLLVGKYQALRAAKKLTKHKRILLAALKNVLADLDCGLEQYPEFAESIAGDLVEASIRSNEKQRSEIKKKLRNLQLKGEIDVEKAEELAFTLDEKTQSLTNWNAMMMESKEARIFCVRLIHKLSEALIGIKAMHSFFQAGSSTSSPLWADPWVQCCAEVTLLGEPLPLPGFSLVLGYQPDDSSKTKIVEMVERISSLIPHVNSVDEVTMGTCIILAHVYFNQISKLTPVSAALLADGAVMHLMDYLRFDCPDNHGTFVTVEALGRAPMFARRSDQTAKMLKMQPLQLQKPLSDVWNINGIFRLTGIKTMKGKKFRGPTTRSDLYGYRNGSKAEAHELCMAPVGEEDTIRPKGRKKSHKPSVMTESLYKKSGSTTKAVRHEPGEKMKRGTRGYNDMIRLQTASHQIDTLPDEV